MGLLLVSCRWWRYPVEPFKARTLDHTKLRASAAHSILSEDLAALSVLLTGPSGARNTTLPIKKASLSGGVAGQ